MIDTGRDQDLQESDNLMLDLIEGNPQNTMLETFIKAINKVLSQKRIGTLWVIAFKNTGGEESMQLARAAFAVIVKMSGLNQKLLDSLAMLEIQEPSAFDDFGEDGPSPDSLNAVCSIIKQDKEFEVFLREWENATKMRKWYIDERNRLTNLEEAELAQKLKALRDSVVEKAKLLVKLQPPTYFQTMDPS